MYLSFYQFKTEPFHITPDPEFLYLSKSHREALAAIIHGIDRRKGFVLVTGEVGTGKTTVVRSYLEQRTRRSDGNSGEDAVPMPEGGKLMPIYLFNADAQFDELVDAVLRGLRIEPGRERLSEKVRRVHWALIEAYKRGENVALFIDEAQHMPVDTLEKLRMLSNIETHQEKLLQIILVGQPELIEKLASHELRQLRQRIVISARIDKLSSRESEDYIRHRLMRASVLPGPVFSRGTIRRIVQASGGYPRTINVIAENALIAGYGSQQRPIGTKTVRGVIADLGRNVRPARSGWKYGGALVAAAALLVVGVMIGRGFGGPDTVVASADSSIAERIVDPALEPAERESDGPSPIVVVEEEPSFVEQTEPSEPEADDSETVDPIELVVAPVETELATAMLQLSHELEAAADEDGAPVEDMGIVEEPIGDEAAEASAVTIDRPEAWQVAVGDTLIEIALAVYGRADSDVMDAIRRENARIQDNDHIQVGQRIKLPLLDHLTREDN